MLERTATEFFKAMIEDNDIFSKLYDIIIKRNIQVSRRKHMFWIHNTIKQQKKLQIQTRILNTQKIKFIK